MKLKKPLFKNLSMANEANRLDYYYNQPGGKPGTFQIPENAFPTDISFV